MTRTRIRKTLLPEKRAGAVALARPRSCFRTECLLSAVLVALLGLFVTWGSSAIVEAGYGLVQARVCLTKLEKQNELLRLEMAQLRAPQRIQEIACGRLGMVNPPAVYVAVKNSGGLPQDSDASVAANIAPRPFLLFGNARAEAHDLSE